MLRTSSALIVLQSLIDAMGKNEAGGGKDGGNKTNLLNSSILKESIRAGYLTSKGVKKCEIKPNSGGGNTKKNFKAARGSDYLISSAKNAFNLLRHAII